MKNKLAMFDMDGTLFNTNDVNAYSYKEAVNHYGFEFELSYWRENCIGRYYKDFLADLNITDEETLQKIHELKGQLYTKYLKYAKENTKLFEVIEALKATHYIALVTVAVRKNVEEILKTFNRFELFDKIFTQEDFSKMKPDPECYLKAMDYFKVKTEDSIIFEDSKAGLIAAKLSGANYCQVYKFNE